jgi:hypothetical protein
MLAYCSTICSVSATLCPSEEILARPVFVSLEIFLHAGPGDRCDAPVLARKCPLLIGMCSRQGSKFRTRLNAEDWASKLGIDVANVERLHCDRRELTLS